MATRLIGDWHFDAQSGELSRNGERRRLEPRAARTLELLIEADGAIVSQERIIDEVWGGRSLSDNSVSVVISQLRRTLEDDARRPAILETVPKRGYRLVGMSRPALVEMPHRPAGWIAAGLITVCAMVAGWSIVGRSAERPVVVVADVANQTGSDGYTPLARATSELIVAQLSGRGFEVRRGGGGDLRFESRLVMWNGKPSLGLTATDEGGVVRWSAMTSGSADRIPAAVSQALDQFEDRVSAR